MKKLTFLLLLVLFLVLAVYFLILKPEKYEAVDMYDEIIKNGFIKVGINTDSRPFGFINEKGETSLQDVYAGGDVAPLGPSTAINAMGAGKRAAKTIIEALA